MEKFIRTPRVSGCCVQCNTPVSMILGAKIDSIRYLLKSKVWCSHCEFWLTSAIKDSFNRWWGRREVWNG